MSPTAKTDDRRSPASRPGKFFFIAVFLLAANTVVRSDDPISAPAPPAEPAREVYLGRTIALPMSHRFADWLLRPEREQEERFSESFDELNLTAGMVVVDIGCGNGAWTLPIAKQVAPSGRVLAVDIQPEMLSQLNARLKSEQINNVDLILGEVDDPKLPGRKADVVLMVDVYHEFSHPESMLRSIRRSLGPRGVVALLEFRKEDPAVPIREHHKMTKSQIMKEYRANGFKLVREYNRLPRQHMMFFARDDSPREEIVPVPTSQVLAKLKGIPTQK